MSETPQDRLRIAMEAVAAERDTLRATLTEETQKRLRAESEEQQQRTYARHCGERLATLWAEVEEAKREWDRADCLARERGRLLGEARAEVERLRGDYETSHACRLQAEETLERTEAALLDAHHEEALDIEALCKRPFRVHCLCPAGLHMPACACECHEEGKP
jgi:hypothetical protein